MMYDCGSVWLLPDAVLFSRMAYGCVCVQLLLDAVLFGVIPIVYEYEGTVAKSLVEQVEAALQGRHAQ